MFSMMDAETIRGEIEEKAVQYDAEKNKINKRIKESIRIAMEKLMDVERELLVEAEAEFGENPFAEFLGFCENPTEDDVKKILKSEIPHDFGPDEESFSSLCREIESLKAWRKAEKTSVSLPSNVTEKSTVWDSITLTWDSVERTSFYQIEVDGRISRDIPITNTFTKIGLLPETEHAFRVRAVRGNSVGEWSNAVKGRTQKAPDFSKSVWKECPDNVDEDRKYSVDEKNSRIATIIGNNCCTIIGSTSIPLNKVTLWSIKVLKSRYNNGGNIFIGVAPSGIDQNEDFNYEKCGWYFNCYDSTLCSGPPHNYKSKKEYGPRNKRNGQYVHTGDSVGVVMDTTKGELSFVLNGVNLGVAYEGIPLDKPLVPCVILYWAGDSAELNTSEVKENVDSSIPVPSNTTAKSITWDSITLTWDAVEGASFYQIEVDGSKSSYGSTTNTFTKIGLLPNAEHTFKVRAVRGNKVSEWSGIVKGMTQKGSFESSAWKECPDDVDEDRKYSVDEENLRIARMIGNDSYSTIIGNTPLPLNQVTSWSIKILKSKRNDGFGIDIGVAPSVINQNEGDNYEKCGWYFYCYDSTLFSGPPHFYKRKEYGASKALGEYFRTGDSVGVVMDTTKGELSFVLNGVNLGVAYEGIPLDKPLVPCVILYYDEDFVKLDPSEVKENVDSSINPSNITAKSTTWDSITLTWDAVEGASFYQIEVDESKSWDASTTNTFTKKGLFSDTEHTFRIRVIRGDSVSEWSCVVKVKAQKKTFKTCFWKECPAYVEEKRRYSVDEKNPRIATKIGGNYWCTIIGNAPLPLNKVTSWSIKVLKSMKNDGNSIFIGVAPSDINQNEENNHHKCGWYFNCFHSILCSGPPHKFVNKEYGPRKGDGKYVHTGDIVGVVMDTAKGMLSFSLKGTNLGVAYKGIPLDKPLVPCVIINNKGDSVELVI